MKALLNRSLLLLLVGLMLTGAAEAGVKQLVVGGSLTEPVSLRLRAAQVTKYLAYALQLSARQEVAVRRCVYEEFRQLDSLAQAPVAVVPNTTDAGNQLRQQSELRIVQRYETAMARLLTPGQLSAFTWLQERQPVARQ
ncbi:hypothetical protein PK28_00200 [Hymenobacter sp. DG25B]|uniref:hypothetical protein n=1 Tax=Hymenobacter sp. DG25B TaxID=1385664 RepID=UPI000540DBBD|nr:hypothetical protein [Hymenobacter sp. DG25B]AIZ62507.1 hypothetical protein PK28_00200 [Hymenobacter sp. DG25B]